MHIDMSNSNWLVDLVYKPDAFGKRPNAAEIRLQLSCINEILAEAEMEEQQKAAKASPLRPKLNRVGRSDNPERNPD